MRPITWMGCVASLLVILESTTSAAVPVDPTYGPPFHNSSPYPYGDVPAQDTVRAAIDLRGGPHESKVRAKVRLGVRPRMIDSRGSLASLMCARHPGRVSKTLTLDDPIVSANLISH